MQEQQNAQKKVERIEPSREPISSLHQIVSQNPVTYNGETLHLGMREQIENLVYEFDGFRVDPVRRQLLHNGAPIPLTSKSFDTLLFLIRHSGSTVSKIELMNAVWSDSAVEENNLTQQISALRRALGERPRDHRFIVTVPGRGYSFVAAIDRRATEDVIQRVAQTSTFFDAGAFRGYSLAFAQILLIALAFAWSAFTDRDPFRPQTLAVMNFKVSASRDEFIGTGISDTLRARLGSVEDLIVRPASVDADEINTGQPMQVDAVVTGSVQRDQDRIRVAVEMVDVSNGRIIWGKTFDEDAANVFALQDAIAVEVARVLNVRFSSRDWRKNDGSQFASLRAIKERQMV